MNVRRTLPQRERSLIGAWCFLDHYGPDDVADSGGMSSPPHPHTGLQTVSWLFTGEIEHRDSAGNHAMVRPGRAQPDDRRARDQPLRGVAAVDHDAARRPAVGRAAGRRRGTSTPGFEHYAPAAVTGDGWEARVFLGSLLGDTSPVTTYSPLLGAEIAARAAAPRSSLDVDPAYEHGVLRRHRRASRRPASRPSRTSSPTSPPGPRRSTADVVRRAGPAAAARRRAVRRVDRDVVELRRPHP